MVQRKGAGRSITEGVIHITKKVVGIEMMKGNEWVADKIVALPAVEVQALYDLTNWLVN